jgi:hypothetical protein
MHNAPISAAIICQCCLFCAKHLFVAAFLVVRAYAILRAATARDMHSPFWP